jgi:hypothetical protein
MMGIVLVAFFAARTQRVATGNHDEINVETDQLSRNRWSPLGVPLGISVLDSDGLPVNVTQFTQRHPKPFGAGGLSGGIGR